MASFVVPDLPPGDYDAFVFCSAINLGMIVGVSRRPRVRDTARDADADPGDNADPGSNPTPTPIVDIGTRYR